MLAKLMKSDAWGYYRRKYHWSLSTNSDLRIKDYIVALSFLDCISNIKQYTPEMFMYSPIIFW